MGYKLGKKSRGNLLGVDADLQRVVYTAIGLTEVDFYVAEGLRTIARQRTLVDSGASRTMRSRHLTGHAVDLWAWVGGEVRWDWPLYFRIARAMQQAAIQESVPVRWGGAWVRVDTLRNPVCADVPEKYKVLDLHEAQSNYIARKLADGKEPLCDGPHFELPE